MKNKRYVIKVGSSILCSQDKGIDTKSVERLVNSISTLIDSGREIVVVSSGAIASAICLLGLTTRPTNVSKLQALAAIGQVQLMDLYRDLLKKQGKLCAQVLLTWDDFNSRTRYLSSKNTLTSLINQGVVTIINENDTVSTDEIKFGDNDKLSALVANLIEADLLIILTDVDGLYDESKRIIPYVDSITEKTQRLVCKTRKEICVGGMSSKLEAAKIVTGSGIACIIANGRSQDILLDIDKGNYTGTTFLTKESRLKAKKSWLLYSAKTKGKLFVDDGAKKALTSGNKSLLCVGITHIEGRFNKGDNISILDKEKREFAKGIVDFSSVEAENMIGKKNMKEAVHRDKLVII
jgi:glutamate 5-kinase